MDREVKTNLPDAVWCSRCDSVRSDDAVTYDEGVELADGKGWRCQTCAKDVAWCDWHDRTLADISDLAAEHGWDFDPFDCRGGVNTRSHYYDLYRDCAACVGDCVATEDDNCECQTLVLRVSDHGSAYCSEDVSLARQPGGDDHDLDYLRRRLIRR